MIYHPEDRSRQLVRNVRDSFLNHIVLCPRRLEYSHNESSSIPLTEVGREKEYFML
jgi:hypothetical protein